MRPPYLWAAPHHHGHSFFPGWKKEIPPHSDVLHEPTSQINETPDTTNPFLERSSDSQRVWYANDGDLNDPQYEYFLCHLKEDGNSYKLKIPNHHNGDVFVKYEEDDILPEQDILNGPSMNGADHTTKREASIGASYGKSSPVQPFIAESKQGIGSSDVEDSYVKFIEKLRFENDLMILEWESGTVITYGADDPSISCERMNTEKGIEGDSTESVPYDFSTSRQYKMELMQVLKKPYDHSEYGELMNKISERKPIIKERRLRNASISYNSSQMGQSYLDCYPDLARQIDAAEPARGLELLRGFFFWLQHLCHKDAFIPWKSFASSDSARVPATDCEIISSLDSYSIAMEE